MLYLYLYWYQKHYAQRGADMNSPEKAIRPEHFYKTDSSGITWEISPLASGTGMLNLSGDLKPGWLGRLSSNLSHNNFNILSGNAVKCSPLRWDASFEVESSHDSLDSFMGFDPLPAVTSSPERVPSPTLKLSDFHIEHSTLHGGSIYTEISGKDCIGFLYGVLRVFSFYSLFPTELKISTNGMAAFDRFWLKGIGASVPGKEDISSLHDRLNSMLPGNA
jgi:hypothetical protein